jgi:hypothetical protein
LSSIAATVAGDDPAAPLAIDHALPFPGLLPPDHAVPVNTVAVLLFTVIVLPLQVSTDPAKEFIVIASLESVSVVLADVTAALAEPDISAAIVCQLATVLHGPDPCE